MTVGNMKALFAQATLYSSSRILPQAVAKSPSRPWQSRWAANSTQATIYLEASFSRRGFLRPHRPSRAKARTRSTRNFCTAAIPNNSLIMKSADSVIHVPLPLENQPPRRMGWPSQRLPRLFITMRMDLNINCQCPRVTALAVKAGRGRYAKPWGYPRVRLPTAA